MTTPANIWTPRQGEGEGESITLPSNPKKGDSPKSFNIAVGLQTRSKKEELAYDNPGHMHEYVFKQTLGRFHWEWVEAAMEAARDPSGPYNPLLLLAPRDHAKTTIIVEDTILHAIGKNPAETLAQIVGSKTPEASKRLRRIAHCIRFNRSYRNLFGDLYPDGNPDYFWNTEKIEVLIDMERAWEEGNVERDPTLAALGITSSVEGGRTNRQVFDDIVSMENVRSETARKSVSEKFWMSFDPMLLPEGVQIFIGTRYHYDDFYAELIPQLDTFKQYTELYLD